jgi:hypothetical protein
MKVYKVLLNKNGTLISPYQSFEFEVGKKYICNDFDTNTKNDCSRGFYATDVEGLIYAFRNLPGYEIWECEVDGKKVEIDMFKRRYEYFKLIRKVEKEEVITLAKNKEQELGWKLSEALYPIHPFRDKQCLQVMDSDVELLKQWASVRASVWDSVRASVWDSVRDSVGDSLGDSVWDSVWASVWDSVGDSVGDSVRDSVWDSFRASVGVYISSLFPNIKKWKYVEHKEGENPFQSAIDLWHKGLMPSFDGKIWRLHGYQGKVLWEGKIERSGE